MEVDDSILWLYSDLANADAIQVVPQVTWIKSDDLTFMIDATPRGHED